MIGVKSIVWMGVLALVGVALTQDLRKPAEARTWHGTIAGIIPYDFRVPTWGGIHETYWNSDSSQVFTPMAFGVGWGVNIPALIRRVRRMAEQRGS